jgi:catalase
MFAYPDAQRYRLGANYQQLPVNRPVSEVYSPYQRDGAMNTTKNYGNDPNYVGAITKTVNFKGKVGANGQSYDIGNHDEWVWGKVESYASEMVDADYEQARGMWALLGKAQEQDVFISNVAGHLGSASKEVQKGAIGESGAVQRRDVADKCRAICQGTQRSRQGTPGRLGDEVTG